MKNKDKIMKVWITGILASGLLMMNYVQLYAAGSKDANEKEILFPYMQTCMVGETTDTLYELESSHYYYEADGYKLRSYFRDEVEQHDFITEWEYDENYQCLKKTIYAFFSDIQNKEENVFFRNRKGLVKKVNTKKAFCVPSMGDDLYYTETNTLYAYNDDGYVTGLVIQRMDGEEDPEIICKVEDGKMVEAVSCNESGDEERYTYVYEADRLKRQCIEYTSYDTSGEKKVTYKYHYDGNAEISTPIENVASGVTIENEQSYIILNYRNIPFTIGKEGINITDQSLLAWQSDSFQEKFGRYIDCEGNVIWPYSDGSSDQDQKN